MTTEMKPLLFITALALTLLTSCGVSVQKRLYRDGFYITTNHKSHNPSVISSPETKAVEGTLDDVAQKAVDSVPVLVPKKSLENQSEFSYEFATADTPEKFESPVSTTDQYSPPTKTSEEKIAKIEKLNKDARAFLKASILVFPIAFLTLSIAFILSLIALSKIRKLARNVDLRVDEQSQLAKHKKRARKTLLISGIILVMVLTAFIIFFSISGPLINGGNIPLRL
jgi:hypothetical protein